MKPRALFYRVLEEFERNYLANELIRNSWNRAKTARELGLSYRTLLYKIERFEIVPPAADECPELA